MLGDRFPHSAVTEAISTYMPAKQLQKSDVNQLEAMPQSYCHQVRPV